MVRSDLFDFSDAYIVVKGNITVILKHLIIQHLMQLLLILQIIMYLVKISWFLKMMHHLLIVLQRLMA